MTREQMIGELLTSLERSEVRLMEWGFTNVAHTAEEIVALFTSDVTLDEMFRSTVPYDEEALWIDGLVSSGLLQRVSFGPPAAYRSRFAESVRLLVNLRQRFSANDWASAPELVSDVRFHLGPRRFPVRATGFDAAWTDLSGLAWSKSVQEPVLKALFGPDGTFELAAFQVRAAQRILGHYRGSGRASGTVVTAGTGGGKTKAFYIPALMGIAADVAAGGAPSTKVLAIYPRNVLLADQFAEATQLAQTVSSALGAMLPRAIRVGALIGDVPFSADFENDVRNRYQLDAWPRPRGIEGRRVPHLRHPKTGKPLVWLDMDRRAGKTVLRLEENTSSVVVPHGVVVLTRDELLASPPDILLTSIEMINKELSSEVGRKALGFNTGQCPLKLILLDEIHTYEGLTGAQVPWILRRLAYWTRGARRAQSVHVVGLSATLQDAPGHLATLSGIEESAIVEVAPDAASDELTTEGQEYNVVLKSHPGSGAGVLATSIQTVMLGVRLLTPRHHKADGDALNPAHFYGRKVFGFTDNLDVVNRWLPDFCDAEQVRKLAALRATQPGEDDRRWEAGQVWRLSEQLGHNLQRPVEVGRTTGQDPGVDEAAEVVLATSALEVGFDDDEVGMVVQHKAPLSAASFIQRKGRAGRRKGMRPWTVVVLSDHGRDRWAFRDSERLFSPNLEKLSVPVFNPYVLRIQATWFLVDWIAARVGHGIPNLYLARPKYFDSAATRVVRDLIDKPERRQQLTQDLSDWIAFSQGGVRVADPTELAQDLLWKPPRAVLRQVVPALWNYLEGDPKAVTPGKQRLLPQFLPERTWEVLDTQDVELALPRGEQIMDVRRALWECVPGRVSRRFAINRKEASKWLGWSARLLTQARPSSAPVDELLDEYTINDELDGVSIFQPSRLLVADVPSDVKNSSNAEWLWSCSVRTQGEPSYVALHTEPIARAIFDSGSAWLHRERASVRVYRYATALRYDLLLARGETQRGAVTVTLPAGQQGEQDAAVGFVRSVDAIGLRVRQEILREEPVLAPELIASLRPAYFRYRAMHSEVLRAATSVFGVGLLITSAVGMVVATALRHQLPLAQAWQRIVDKPGAAKKVLDSVLTGEADVDQEDGHNSGRGVQEVIKAWENPAVAAEMDMLVRCLWDAPGEEWQRWLRVTLLETIRAGIEVAVQSVLPETPEKDFSVEVIEDDGGASIWILEAEAGGTGVIDRLLTESGTDPHLFDTALEASLMACRAERMTDNVVCAVNNSLKASPELGTAFAEVRSAGSYTGLDEARASLVSALAHADCDADKQAVTALVGKVLMPGSSVATDHWLRRLTAGRHAASARLGVAIDPCLWAYWTTSLPKRRELMTKTLRWPHGHQPTAAQVTASVVRLTLDPCRDSCPQCLGTTSEMRGVLASRRLARQWLNLGHTDQVIDVNEGGDWLATLDQALAEGSRVRLRFVESLRGPVGTALTTRLAARYDRGYSLSGFRVAAVTQKAGQWELLIRIDDMETH